MKIVSIGGGPAGLYFGILMKKLDPSADVTVYERNRPDDTFGFGVVFSDATLGNLGEADPESYAEIRRHFFHWDDIDTYFGGERLRSTGHGFCGMERKRLLMILQQRAAELGVDLQFETEIGDPRAIAAEADLVLGADGVASNVRDTWADTFQPTVNVRPNKFVWLGTTVPFEAFTFYFKKNEHGLWRVHAYRYQETGEGPRSTFIVECTPETWTRSGMDQADEDQTIAYLEQVFEKELDGHPLIKNRSIWRNFPTVSNRCWHHDNVVLVGDAVHTAHFSIGSGTKLAMEDAISLVGALRRESNLDAALSLYETERRPDTEKLQRAAQTSLEWFENTERYAGLEPIQFNVSLMTRSLRVTHDNLALRDPELVTKVDRWFARRAAEATGTAVPDGEPPLPAYAPLKLRELIVKNRLVAAPCPPAEMVRQARAGAGLALTEPTSAVDLRADGWRELTAAVREAGAAAGLVLTCPHPGYQTQAPAGEEELRALLCEAATVADDAGFDLLELDLSSGVLVELAAEPAERAGLVELAAAVREAWPAARPMSVRLIASDWGEGDFTPAGAVSLARDLADRGIDLITAISDPERRPDTRLVDVPFAETVRLEAGVAVATEAGIWSLDDVASVIAAGRADLAGFHAASDVFEPHRDE